MIEIPFSKEEGFFFAIARHEAIQRFMIFFEATTFLLLRNLGPAFHCNLFWWHRSAQPPKKDFHFNRG